MYSINVKVYYKEDEKAQNNNHNNNNIVTPVLRLDDRSSEEYYDTSVFQMIQISKIVTPIPPQLNYNTKSRDGRRSQSQSESIKTHCDLASFIEKDDGLESLVRTTYCICNLFQICIFCVLS